MLAAANDFGSQGDRCFTRILCQRRPERSGAKFRHGGGNEFSIIFATAGSATLPRLDQYSMAKTFSGSALPLTRCGGRSRIVVSGESCSAVH